MRVFCRRPTERDLCDEKQRCTRGYSFPDALQPSVGWLPPRGAGDIRILPVGFYAVLCGADLVTASAIFGRFSRIASAVRLGLPAPSWGFPPFPTRQHEPEAVVHVHPSLPKQRDRHQRTNTFYVASARTFPTRDRRLPDRAKMNIPSTREKPATV